MLTLFLNVCFTCATCATCATCFNFKQVLVWFVRAQLVAFKRRRPHRHVRGLMVLEDMETVLSLTHTFYVWSVLRIDPLLICSWHWSHWSTFDLLMTSVILIHFWSVLHIDPLLTYSSHCRRHHPLFLVHHTTGRPTNRGWGSELLPSSWGSSVDNSTLGSECLLSVFWVSFECLLFQCRWNLGSVWCRGFEMAVLMFYVVLLLFVLFVLFVLCVSR